MAMHENLLHRLSELYVEARPCRHCFDNDSTLLHGHVAMPQLRWVGPGYSKARTRVLVILLNPGTGSYHGADRSIRMRKLLQAIKPGNSKLQELMDFMRDDMRNWTCKFDSSYTMMTFYTRYARLGLSEDTIGFMNLALCGARRASGNGSINVVPPSMLDDCMTRHTLRFLRVLKPRVLLMGGRHVQARKQQILAACPPIVRAFSVPHYSFRKRDKASMDSLLADTRGELLHLLRERHSSTHRRQGADC